MLKSFQLFFIVSCCVFTGTLSTGPKSWTYTILDFNTNSSDEDCLKSELKVERVGRGDYAISGSVYVGCEITDDFMASVMVEVFMYRSALGNNNYKLMPWMLPKQSANEFLDIYYKNTVMKGLRNCSNAPQSVDGKPPRVTEKIYTCDRCVLSMDEMPSFAVPGFYKSVLKVSGPVTFFGEASYEIELKS